MDLSTEQLKLLLKCAHQMRIQCALNAIKTAIIPPLNPHEPLNQSNLLNVH